MNTDSVANVISRLEARKSEIETTIMVLRRELLGEAVEIPAGGTGQPDPSNRTIQDDTFLGMRVPAAARKYLQMVKRPQTTPEIADALQRGGVHSTAQNFTTTVYTALGRQNDIVRIGNRWSMRKWHPNLKVVRRRTNGVSEESDGATPEETS